jgi:Golgi SNAP receptor complex protein 2
LRQGTAIRKDLDALADGSETSPALLGTAFPTICLEETWLTRAGQINASLTSFSRTVDDYNKLAKQELVPEKQQKAYERIKTFRSELSDYRERFDRLKQEADERVRLFHHNPPSISKSLFSLPHLPHENAEVAFSICAMTLC